MNTRYKVSSFTSSRSTQTWTSRIDKSIQAWGSNQDTRWDLEVNESSQEQMDFSVVGRAASNRDWYSKLWSSRYLFEATLEFCTKWWIISICGFCDLGSGRSRATTSCRRNESSATTLGGSILQKFETCSWEYWKDGRFVLLYVVFEREAREFQSCLSLQHASIGLTQISKSLISQYHHSNRKLNSRFALEHRYILLSQAMVCHLQYCAEWKVKRKHFEIRGKGSTESRSMLLFAITLLNTHWINTRTTGTCSSTIRKDCDVWYVACTWCSSAQRISLSFAYSEYRPASFATLNSNTWYFISTFR